MSGQPRHLNISVYPMKLIKPLTIITSALLLFAACEVPEDSPFYVPPQQAEATTESQAPSTTPTLADLFTPTAPSSPSKEVDTTPSIDTSSIIEDQSNEFDATNLWGDIDLGLGVPEPVETGLALIEQKAGQLIGTQIIINPETQVMYHIVDGKIRKEYKVSTGRGSVDWQTGEVRRLGNESGSQRSSTGYMTTIGSEKTVCNVDEIGAQWTTTSCFGRYAETTWDGPGESGWADEPLHGELTTVILRMYPGEASNSNNMTRGILIHGTNKYASVDLQIPGSRGCTRMMPADILDLAAHLDDGVNQIYVLDREPIVK